MIWLARHGETTWNVAGRYQGRRESELTSRGERQAQALAAYFGERGDAAEAVPERVYSSPLLRCTQTARPSAERVAVGVECDERLLEIGHGTWEGRYRQDIEREDPALYRLWREEPARVTFEGGESLADVLARWRSFACELARRSQHALVTTHDAVIRCALVDLLDRPLADFWRVRVENGAFALLATNGERLALVEECDARHLRDLRAEISGQAL